ncbi:hypothetical protein V2J09_006557 [Rumex salicifolius]
MTGRFVAVCVSGSVMDLDLNWERLQPQSHREDSPERLFVETGDHHQRIEERIRLLESVVARTRFRPPMQSSSTPTTQIPTPSINSRQSDVIGNIPKPQPRIGSIKPGKIDGGTHLLAEALATDSTCEETLPSSAASTSTYQRKTGGSIYDCNICFSLSKDPVLTCCGHLFCWPCFYCLPSTDSYSSKECPVCQGEVLETNITPIYGAAGSSNDDNSIPFTPSIFHPLHPVKIPPRPRARRIENVRQRLGFPPLPPNQRVNQISVHPTLTATQNTTPPRSSTSNPNLTQHPSNFSGFMSQPGGPLGETLADHMEFLVNRQQLPRTQTQRLPFNAGSDMETRDSIFPSFAPLVETNSMAPPYPLPPQSQTGTSLGNADSGIPVTDGNNGSNETVASGSSSSRRRASIDVGSTVRGRRRRRRRVQLDYISASQLLDPTHPSTLEMKYVSYILYTRDIYSKHSC